MKQTSSVHAHEHLSTCRVRATPFLVGLYYSSAQMSHSDFLPIDCFDDETKQCLNVLFSYQTTTTITLKTIMLKQRPSGAANIQTLLKRSIKQQQCTKDMMI